MKANSNALFYSFKNCAALNTALARRIAHRLDDDILCQGKATLAVSGGRTPPPLFTLLSQQALDWQQVLITLVDERWVDCHHPNSNEKLVRDYLLQNQAAKAQLLALKNSAQTPQLGQTQLNVQLEKLPPALSVVVLGMGEDGHTASFFPGAAELDDALFPAPKQHCQSIQPITAEHARMTLTLPRILASALIIVHIVGDKKRDRLKQAQQTDASNSSDPTPSIQELSNRASPIQAMPIRAIIQQKQTPVEIYWCE